MSEATEWPTELPKYKPRNPTTIYANDTSDVVLELDACDGLTIAGLYDMIDCIKENHVPETYFLRARLQDDLDSSPLSRDSTAVFSPGKYDLIVPGPPTARPLMKPRRPATNDEPEARTRQMRTLLKALEDEFEFRVLMRDYTCVVCDALGEMCLRLDDNVPGDIRRHLIAVHIIDVDESALWNAYDLDQHVSDEHLTTPDGGLSPDILNRKKYSAQNGITLCPTHRVWLQIGYMYIHPVTHMLIPMFPPFKSMWGKEVVLPFDRATPEMPGPVEAVLRARAEKTILRWMTPGALWTGTEL